MPLIQSILRRLNLMFVGFSAGGWLVFVAGFGGQQLSPDPFNRGLSFLFVPWWIAAFAGPVTFILLGIDLLVGERFRLKVANIFRGTSFFFIIIYIAALAAPIFVVATLIASAAGGIQDVVDAIDIPDLSEFVSRRRVLEQAFDTVIDGIEQGTQEIADLLDRFLDLLVDFIAGILYVILTILTGLFLFAMSAQFSGSFLSIFWLGMSMMIRPFIHRKTKPQHKMLC